ncbi:MAG TPA: phosphotransferase [Terracidiphilus sp.]|nr:phosphotransferase [Terracidiphilus sp.]
MNTTAKAHGLDGTLVEPDWPPLTPSEVSTLLDRYSGCGGPREIVSVSPRPFSAASVVNTQGGRVFVKRHHRMVRDREGLLEEHRFIGHLRGNGAPAPLILATASGETAIESGEWTYEVHEAPAGIDLYQDAISWTPFRSVHHAHWAGQALARLHCASRGYSAPPRMPRPLVASFTIFADANPASAIERYLSARPVLGCEPAIYAACSEALQLLAPFHSELKPLLPGLEPFWTHNDLHASNLFWSDTTADARAVAIIDFGLADRTNAVHDLAHAIERNVVEWLALVEHPQRFDAVPVHLDDLDALLAGYELVRPLSEVEASALAPMTALCHAEFALTEADYFLGVLHSQSQAHMAVPDYLVGHARWFSSRAGTALLDVIRQWAVSQTELRRAARR